MLSGIRPLEILGASMVAVLVAAMVYKKGYDRQDVSSRRPGRECFHVKFIFADVGE